MARRKGPSKTPPSPPQGVERLLGTNEGTPFGPRSMEAMMRDLTTLLSEQEFGSMEEANAFLESVVGGPLPKAPVRTDPASRARALVDAAYSASSREEAIRLGHQALDIDADCVDAYVLLAEAEAKTPEQARALYQKGVEAGERALGPKTFAKDAGHFWGILETRPYMRARLGLAEALWLTGEREAAVGHLQELLRLNPGDNQGARYLLADVLLKADRDDDLEALLSEYAEEGSAHWLYHTALLRYRQESDDADAALAEAVACNPHVPRYLLGKRKLPKRMPTYQGFGDDSEAVVYVTTALALWRGSHGALAWLRRQTSGRR